MPYFAKKKNISRLLNRLSRDCEVVAPVKKGKDFDFQPVLSGKDVDLKGYINTRFSPKEYFLPKKETLFTFEKSRKVKVKAHLPEEKRVIFGIRPCDVNALLVLDRIFTEDYEDVVYTKRRENTTLIVVNCKKTGDYCFCGSFGTNELRGGYDLLLTETGNDYFVEVGSEKGEEIIEKNNDLFKWTKRSVRKPKLKFKKKVDVKKLVQ